MTPEETLAAQMSEQMRKQQYAQMQDMLAQQQKQQSAMIPNQAYAIIAAIDATWGGFSNKGEIPWNIPEDFKHFKEITTGSGVVMGRKTYEDINKRLGDKAIESVLPGRKCFVVSRTLTELPNAVVVPNIRHVEYLTDEPEKPIFIIGGRRVFVEGIALANELYLTLINRKIECDMHFPIKTVAKYFRVESVRDSSDPDVKFFHFVRK
ncbi:dihydrofolate reductase [Candidatus Dojkabacteria bacterium]|jgi:dihydrofolate reductase|nr:dihydrofolate reductase [Candidatus Dojkabacteria bacterium]